MIDTYCDVIQDGYMLVICYYLVDGDFTQDELTEIISPEGEVISYDYVPVLIVEVK
jgi:hypothetical protein